MVDVPWGNYSLNCWAHPTAFRKNHDRIRVVIFKPSCGVELFRIRKQCWIHVDIIWWGYHNCLCKLVSQTRPQVWLCGLRSCHTLGGTKYWSIWAPCEPTRRGGPVATPCVRRMLSFTTPFYTLRMSLTEQDRTLVMIKGLAHEIWKMAENFIRRHRTASVRPDVPELFIKFPL